MEAKKREDVVQPADEESRRLAKALLRKARLAALACLEPGSGRPLASRVSLATDVDGRPIFLISQLSSHFEALATDPRCSLLVGEAGVGDPLTHPRMTVIGRAERIADAAERERVKDRFLRRQPKAKLYADFGDFAFWRVDVERASLNGGFGKAFELQAADLLTDLSAFPDMLANERGAVEHMNEDHSDAVGLYATKLLGEEDGAWRLAGLDPEGMDLRWGDRVARLWFEPALTKPEEMRPRLVALAKRARGEGGEAASES